jgi:hypothetical protein
MVAGCVVLVAMTTTTTQGCLGPAERYTWPLGADRGRAPFRAR